MESLVITNLKTDEYLNINLAFILQKNSSDENCYELYSLGASNSGDKELACKFTQIEVEDIDKYYKSLTQNYVSTNLHNFENFKDNLECYFKVDSSRNGNLTLIAKDDDEEICELQNNEVNID